MSRQELAEAVNAYLYAETGRVARVDAHYVGRLKQGVIRWPHAHYRRGLRAVLGAEPDAGLGLYLTRRFPSDERHTEWRAPDQGGQADGGVEVAAPQRVSTPAEVRVIVAGDPVAPSSGGARVYSLESARRNRLRRAG